MKFYLQAFVKSLYDIEWLRGQKKNGKQSATYVVLLILLLSIVFSIFALFQLDRVGNQLRTKVLDQIPEFELMMEDGVLSVSGLEQPYMYSFDEDTDDSFLLYVDTVTTSSLSLEDLDIEKDKNIMMVTREKMTIFDMESGSTQINDYKEIPNESLTKAEVESWYDGLMNRKITIFTVILVVTFVLLGIGKMIYLLMLALIAFTIQQILKKGYVFGEMFTMGLFAITAPSIVVMILRMFGYGVPYLYTLLVMGYLLTVVFLDKKSESPKKVESVK
jgi:maltodextrin utilization protein YvdJ